jgi:hypothetical protein
MMALAAIIWSVLFRLSNTPSLQHSNTPAASGLPFLLAGS